MKCPRCGGKGKVLYPGVADYYVKCNKCDGTGEVEQTEQEYIQTCNTEQLAELIALICGSNILRVWRIMYHCADSDVDAVKMWLKQPHTNEVGK